MTKKKYRALWISLLTLGSVLMLWTVVLPQGVTNALTRAALAVINVSPTGTWDFTGGVLKLQRGTGAPAAGDCDAGDGSDVGKIYVRTDTAGGGDDIHAWLCLDDDNGWQRVMVQNPGAVSETAGNFEATDMQIEAKKFFVEEPLTWEAFEVYDSNAVDIIVLRSQTASGGIIDWIHGDTSGYITLKFNNASDRNFDITNAGAGAAVLTVPAGGKLGLEGSAGDTYTIRTVATASLDSYHDGTLATQTRNDHWMPPSCPVDLNDVSFGGFCMDVGTGKIRYRGVLEAIP